MSSMERFPPEIMEMILGQIESSQRPTCARVCKTWQAVVEKSTLHTWNLQINDLGHFLEIICPQRRRHPLVKHVTLSIPLGSSIHYPAPSDDLDAMLDEDDNDESEEEDVDEPEEFQQRSIDQCEAFCAALIKLLVFLTAFNDKQVAFSLELLVVGTDDEKRRKQVQQQGLKKYNALDHAACGVNDDSDGFNSDNLGPPSVRFKPLRQDDKASVPFVPSSPASFNSMDWKSFTLTQQPYFFLYNGFDTVQAITELRISTRCFPYIRDLTRSLIMRSLPNLTSVAFEAWHVESPDDFFFHEIPLNWFGATLPNWPQSLKSIYLYQVPDMASTEEDDDDSEESEDDEDDPWYKEDVEQVRDASAAALGWEDYATNLLDARTNWKPKREILLREIMPKHLASRSCGMEELGICNVIDGRNFFAAFKNINSLPLWPNLRLLTFTASLLPGGDPNNGDDSEVLLQSLLKLVAKFVRRMPKLQTLELYEAGRDSAALFQYSNAGGSPTAQWISTWPVEIDDEVKEAWESIPSPDGFLRTEFLPVKVVEIYEGPMNFIDTYILTKGKIMDPYTLREQKRLEEIGSEMVS
ncbi:hypothetical protein PG984_010424 [Apiospora sp. TS-2023a]